MEIGTTVGKICAMCQRGTIVPAGGCDTCSSCGMQFKCGL